MKTFFTFVCGMLAIALMSWFLLTYVLLTDVQRVDRTIEKARRCVENGSIIRLANLLSSDYHHENGLGREEVLGALKELFQQTSDIRVRLISTSTKVDGPLAQSTVRFLFAAKSINNYPYVQSLLADASQESKEIHVTLVKQGRSWKIQRTVIDLVNN
jgi:hypothetical protein